MASQPDIISAKGPAVSLSEQELLAIVAAASSIDERLSKGFLPDEEQTDDEIVQARLVAWCQVITRGDWKQFRQRLAWDDLEEDTVRRVLGAVRVPAGMQVPSWAETLREAVNMATGLPGGREEGRSADGHGLDCLNPENPLPFEEILVAFVMVAHDRLAVQARDADSLLSREASITLQRNLLQVLTTYAAQALFLEFCIERAQSQSTLDRLVIREDNDSRTHYLRFVERMRRGRLVPFFREYNVLARILASVTDLWVEATVEFLHRLMTDWSELQQVFGGERDLGQVASVQPAISDPHCGRRMVMALTFTSGCKVVYKPKDLGTEDAYYRLLTWCNEQGLLLPFKVLRVINHSSYGWVEFVPHTACKDQEAACHYYRRAGMLLCLVHILEGTDCHFENLIACGEHPILIDTETLLQHRPRSYHRDEGTHAQLLASEQLDCSVLRTDLLPNWQVRHDVVGAHDVSGLGEISLQGLQVRISRWQDVNTDRMAPVTELVTMQVQENQPMLDDTPLRLDEYSAEVIVGFRQMYRFLLDHRDDLLAPSSPLGALAHHQVRFLYRSTHVYTSMAQKLAVPRYLRNGADRSIQLEVLGRTLLLGETTSRDKGDRSCWWPVFVTERQAMEQTDIPFFTAYPDGDALIIPSGRNIEMCLEEPSFNLALAKLSSLNDEDLEQQVAFIQGSLSVHLAHKQTGRPGGMPMPAMSSMDTDEHLCPAVSPTPTDLVTQALVIAEQLRRRAIRAADGSAAWIAPHYLVQAQRYQLQPLGYDLYDGMCGVALFLAAIEKVTGGAGYRELALGALQPLCAALRQHGHRTAMDLGIGATLGSGSVVYTLTHVSRWLDEPALLADATLAASLITTERIRDDRNLDITAGTAGAILGLLVLYDVSAEPALLDKAIVCGERLLQARTESQAGLRAWSTVDGKMLTGFSHGAAGIAYALQRLYAATGDTALLAVAEEGIAYEDDIFSPTAGNWPDLRRDEQLAFMTSWCHGAPGIALARIGGLSVLDNAQIRKDIEIAVQTTEAFGIQDLDHLCCGNLGRADILQVAASRLSRPELRESARKRAWNVVTRAERTGSFSLHPLLPRQVYNPGFFQGTAGIGYVLLRMAQPESLPCVLLLE
jgi:type 2 lantibiotic biosynthesis protein LanM